VAAGTAPRFSFAGWVRNAWVPYHFRVFGEKGEKPQSPARRRLKEIKLHQGPGISGKERKNSERKD
jgi:hypothetical protein